MKDLMIIGTMYLSPILIIYLFVYLITFRDKLDAWWQIRDRVLLKKAELISAQIESDLPADFSRRREVLAIVKHLREEVLPKMLAVEGEERTNARWGAKFLVSVLQMIHKCQFNDSDNLLICYHYRVCIEDAKEVGVDIDELDLTGVDWGTIDEIGRLESDRTGVSMHDVRPVRREQVKN